MSADQHNGATWPFTTQQLTETVTRLWPGSDIGGDLDDVVDLEIHVEGRILPFSWQVEYQVLLFPDQDPLDAPARVIHRLLRELAPQVPAVWWSEADATLEPVDLSPDPEAFVRDFAG
ncbi:hypothetical protein AB0B21_35080 [Streptomyces rimosus]|uniref:hypothetical protein n=1 Tax=Streptomyces rimosus TaxID=1927 RepID=UPI000A811C98|nr:hypothetical protein [Streptomyces rimosus]